MPEASPNPELMRSLGKLVRGLSALFWGLPLALVVCFHTAKADTLKTYHLLPPLAATGLLLYGLWLLGAFQKQERVWRNALDRSMILSLINFGLSPFLYWSNKMPQNGFFGGVVIVLVFSGLLFLASLNSMLRRLGAMIPDEALRLETKQFTSLNLNVLSVTFLIAGMYLVLSRIPDLPINLQALMIVLDQGNFWLLVLLVLLPMALTMALLWKTKQVIVDNVFGTRQG